MALKSILILTASFGEGHNAAARNLAAAIHELSPGTRVAVRDLFREAYGPLNEAVRRGYLFVINRLPWLWEIVFRWLDRPRVVGQGIGIFARAGQLLVKTLRDDPPDVLVSTYPGYGALLDWARRRTAVPCRAVTLVTDSLTVNAAWYQARVDAFLVANEATAAVMKSKGVAADSVHVTGFPVPLMFSGASSRTAPPPLRVLYMVNAGHHLAASITKALLQIEGIELTVTVGRDDALGRELTGIAAQVGRPLEVHGWTPLMPELIRRSHVLIGKAGGATVQEALAAATPMVITQVVPGQEEGNARLLLDAGAGVLAATPDAIADAVRRIAADGVLQKMETAARELGCPDSARQTARFLLSPAS